MMSLLKSLYIAHHSTIRPFLITACIASSLVLVSSPNNCHTASFANPNYTTFNDADFSGVNLYNANLYGANLRKPQFSRVKGYKCTNLTYAQNLTPQQVKQALNWQQAIYDPLAAISGMWDYI